MSVQVSVWNIPKRINTYCPQLAHRLEDAYQPLSAEARFRFGIEAEIWLLSSMKNLQTAVETNQPEAIEAYFNHLLELIARFHHAPGGPALLPADNPPLSSRSSCLIL